LNQKQLTPSGVKGNLLAAESFLRWLKDQGKDLYDSDPYTIYQFTEHLAIEQEIKHQWPTCIYIAVVVVRRSSHKKKNVP